MRKSINNVTTNHLRLALKVFDIDLSLEVVDNIIDIIELLEKKGKYCTIEDIAKLDMELMLNNKFIPKAI